jgi:hypothetical protein
MRLSSFSFQIILLSFFLHVPLAGRSACEVILQVDHWKKCDRITNFELTYPGHDIDMPLFDSLCSSRPDSFQDFLEYLPEVQVRFLSFLRMSLVSCPSSVTFGSANSPFVPFHCYMIQKLFLAILAFLHQLIAISGSR